MPAVFSSGLGMPRGWFLVVYVFIAVPFLHASAKSSGLCVMNQLRRRWTWGILGAVLVGAFMAWSILRQPASTGPEGLRLVLALVWLGLIYGALDALFLNVMPVLAAWEAFVRLGATESWPGRLTAGVGGLLASLFVTALYHLGYTEFRGPMLTAPLFGNGIMTLGYLLTGSPLTAVGAHVALHVTSVLHGFDTAVTLPPHYR